MKEEHYVYCFKSEIPGRYIHMKPQSPWEIEIDESEYAYIDRIRYEAVMERQNDSN